MSTNSNEVDDLMEEGHTKQTKLQKFIRTIDQQTMRAIKKYLDSNQNPVTEKDSKSDKIKLYTDLLIIRRFKIHQNELNNKKKIDELCQALKQETQFSIATIRERIQKKLSNVSKQQIITHINLNLNFAFNTKRKLVPVKSSENNKKSEDQRDITFQDQVVQKKVVPPIQVQSGGEESQVLQVPAPATKQIVPSKKNAIKQEERKIKTSVKKTNDNNLYNEFREISDHDSDQQMLIVKTDNKYKVTTKKGQAMLAQILEEGKKFLQREQQLKNQEPQEIKQAIYEQQDDIIEEKKSEKKSEKESEKESGKQENISNNQQDLFNQKNDIKISSVHERPDEEELKCYCSVEDWKLVQADKTYYFLKWYPDEDAFLREIILNPQSKNSDIQLQVLKKFKTSQNVYNRIRNLKLDVPKALLQKLQIGELD